MSSAALRDAVRAAWPAVMPLVPYIDTINLETPRAPLPPIWGTLGFDMSQRVRLTLSKNPLHEETGSVSVVIVASSGEGDAAAVQAATDAMHAWTDWFASDAIYFTAVGAPQQVDLEAAGNWFLVAVRCAYVAQSRSNPVA